MNGQDHDPVAPRFGRRTMLRGAAVLGAAGVVALKESAPAEAATPAIGPRWIAVGPDPTTQMYVSWSMGTANGATQTVLAPKIRWGTTTSYGNVIPADSAQAVVLPTPPGSEPAENTVYYHVLLKALTPATTYHYSVSNDGVAWSADTTFRTAAAGASNFRFTAFGDIAAGPNAKAMAMLTKSLGSTLHLVPGDLSYATPQGLKYPDVTGFAPTQWDSFLSAVGPVSAQSIPWMASVGAHEVEPLGSDGYAGFVTRFAQPYDLSSGSPVAFAYQVGNVAFVHLDGNDLSAQTTINTGYSAGAQTTWLARQLATYRATGSTVDFIVVVENCCCYSTNTNHGSDGGLRDVWGPVFDKYAVDLVISGHLHAYERSNPMINQVATRKVAVGGTVRPVTDGTTYICCGGGGNGLYPSWYGTTDAGDAGSTTAPKVWRWSGGDTATGGTGSSQDVVDPAKGFSANRRALFHCLVVDVVAPTAANSYLTSLQIQTVAPAQSSSAVTDINTTTVIDSVTLSRPSVSTPIDPTCPPD